MSPRTRPMTPREENLVAMLVVLRDKINPVVDQITAGKLEGDDALKLAGALEMIARALRPVVIPPDDTGDSGGR